MNLLGSKKGQVENYIAVVIVIFTFAIMSMIATVIFLGLQSSFTDAGLYTGIIESTGDSFLSALRMYDNIIVLLVIVLIIGVGISSFTLNTAPRFFIVTLIMASFMGFVAYFFSFMFGQFVSDSTFNTVNALFPNTILIATNLHWVALVALLIGSFTLYAKKEQVGGELG